MYRVPFVLTAFLAAFLSLANAPALAMQDASFERLLGQLDGAFSSDQVNLVRSAAQANTFRSHQVRTMLEHLSFSSTQLEALRIVADRIEDPENAFEILAAFTFSSDKREAQEILSRAEPLPSDPDVVIPPRPILIQTRYARLGILDVPVWDASRFAELERSLMDASFSSDKLALLATAASADDGFTADQVVRVLRTLPFSRDRLEAVHSLRYRVIDSSPDELAAVLAAVDQDAARLDALRDLVHVLRPGASSTPVLAAFDFPRNQDEARRLLDRTDL